LGVLVRIIEICDIGKQGKKEILEELLIEEAFGGVMWCIDCWLTAPPSVLIPFFNTLSFLNKEILLRNK
jgi:hypothetical protein